MRKTKKTMKRVVSVLLALAMVVTGISYTPKTVSAATIAGNNKTYEANVVGAGFVGFVCTEEPTHFVFAWDGGLSGQTATVTIQNDADYSASLGDKENGGQLTAAELDALDLEEGEYTLSFTGQGDFESKVQEVSLTVKNSGDTPDPDPEIADGTELLKSTDFNVDDATQDTNDMTGKWIQLGTDGTTYTNNGNGSVTVQIPEITGGNDYDVQMKQNNIQIVAGKWYKAKYTVTSDVDKKFHLIIQRDGKEDQMWEPIPGQLTTTVNAGETKNVELVFQAKDTIEAIFGIMMGYVGETTSEAANVTISNVSLTVYSEEPTTESTTTEPSVEPAIKNSTTITAGEILPMEKVALYGFEQTEAGYKVVFDDPNNFTNTKKFEMAEGDSVIYEVYINGTDETNKVASVSQSGDFIDYATIEALGLAPGKDNNKVYVKAVLHRTNGEGTEEDLSSAMSAEAAFAYKTVGVVAEENQKNTGLGKVFIDTLDDSAAAPNGALLTSNNKDKHAAIITITDNTDTWEDFGTVNVRGNSTSNAKKKAYNVKFDSKQDVFGFGKAKKWSLLANALDKSLLRNQVAMNFMRALESSPAGKNQYSSKCRTVDVYVDSHYLGTYLLIESVEAGSSRVDIDAENENSTDNLDMLLEINAIAKERDSEGLLEDDYATAEADQTLAYHFTINEPERPGTGASEEEINAWDALYTTKREGVIHHLKQFEAAADVAGNGANSDFEKISQLIDVDSFVDFYIVSELFRTEDIAYSSTRFYTKTVNGTTKLYAGPLWDLDLSSGNNGDATKPDADKHAQDMKWFKALMNNAEFKALVSKRYEEVLPLIKKIYAKGDEAVSAANADPQDEELSIYKLADLIRASAEANYTEAYNVNSSADNDYQNGWGISTNENAGGVIGNPTEYQSYDEAVGAFADWMESRNPYLMKQLDASDPDAEIEDTDYENLISNRFYNLALDKELTPSNQYNDNAQRPTDGVFYHQEGATLILVDETGGAGSWGGSGESWATIDLGAYYDASTIDKILISYKDNATNDTVKSRGYQVLFSPDNRNWTTAVNRETVADWDYTEHNATVDTLSMESGTPVRYVKVYYPKTANYGMQITEIAVLDTNRDAEELEVEVPATPEFTVEPGDEDGQIKVNITPSAGQVDEYVIYVDGEEALRTPDAGEHILSGYIKGEHQVSVEAVLNGMYSEPSEEKPVSVEGTVEWDMEGSLTDPLLNLAYQQTPLGSDNKEGDIKYLTDGNVGSYEERAGVNVDATRDGWFQVDLGKVYTVESIDNITLWYRSADANFTPAHADCSGYDIQYSKDGDTFVTVKTVTEMEPVGETKTNWDDSGRYVLSDDIDKDAAKAQINAVRYVRVVYHGTIGYGAQAREMAVYNKAGTAEEYKVEQIDPLSADELASKNIPADAQWEHIEGTEYYYYDPDNIRQAGTIAGDTGILNCGTRLPGDLKSVKFNGVEIADSYEGAQFYLDTARISAYGVYEVVIEDATGAISTMYYKKEKEMNYAVSGITATEVTQNSATITWTNSEDIAGTDYTYEIYIDGQKVTTDALTNMTTSFNATGLDLQSGQEYTIEIKTMNGEVEVASATGTLKWVDENAKPDLVVSKVEINGDIQPGQRVVVELTIKNQGGADAIIAEGYNNGQAINDASDPWSHIIVHLRRKMGDTNTQVAYSGLPLPQSGANGEYVLAVGATSTVRYNWTVPDDVESVAYQIGGRVDTDGDIDELNEDNNELFIDAKASSLPPVENLRATLTETGHVTVSWSVATDENEKGYTYEVYVDGDLQEGLTIGPNTTATRITTTLENLSEGRHQIEVRRKLEDDISPAASTYIIVYDETKLTWKKWEDGRTQDIDNDTWWYTKDILDGDELYEDPNWGPQITTDGTHFQFIIAENGNGTRLLTSTEVTIRGVTYPVERKDGEGVLAYQPNGDDKIYLSHELFPVPDNVRERIFPITVTGKMGGADVVKTFLVKLVNEDYATADLSYRPADETDEANGHVVFGWTDPEEIANYGYALYYYDPADPYDPNAEDPSTNVQRRVVLAPGEYEEKDGKMEYHLTENGIYCRSNTEIRVVPIVSRTGREYGEDVGMAVAQAELKFYQEPAANPGAYVGEESSLEFKVINVGTGVATTKAQVGNNNLQIKLTEYTDASRETIAQDTGNTNPRTYNKDIGALGFKPGEVETASYNYNFKDRAVHYFTAEIDPNNEIYELDADSNNYQDFEIIALYKGKLNITRDEATGEYSAEFSPREDIWGDGTNPPSMQNNVKEFLLEYYDHGEYKTCTIRNPEDLEIDDVNHVYKCKLKDVTYMDADQFASISAMYYPTEGGDPIKMTFADTNPPFVQDKDMDWTRLKDENGDALFMVNGDTARTFIEYKIVDTTYADMNYEDIATSGQYNFNAEMGGYNYMTLRFAPDKVVEVNDAEKTSTTKFEFAQIPKYNLKDDKANIDTAQWIDMPTQGCDILLEDGSKIEAGDSLMIYNGNGFNCAVGNLAPGCYYLMRFTNYNQKDAEGNSLSVTVAYRIRPETDEDEEGWMRARAQFGSGSTDAERTLPVYYCGHLEEDVKDSIADGDSLEKDTPTTRNPRDIATLYYDPTTDIEVSSIFIYNGDHIALMTSAYARFDSENYQVAVARGEYADSSVKPITDFVPISGGTQGSNRMNIQITQLTEQLPIHSAKGGETDREFYVLRVYKNYDANDPTTYDDPDEYVEVPLMLSMQIPKIQEPQAPSAYVTYDDAGEAAFGVRWGESNTQATDGYVYKLFIGDEDTGTQIGDDYYTKGSNVTFTMADYEDAFEAQGLTGADKKITLVAYWCEQKITMTLPIEADRSEGWYDIDDEPDIAIQAGQSQYVDVTGHIRYYHNQLKNRASIVAGYNGYYISISGNGNFFNEYSTVYVATEPEELNEELAPEAALTDEQMAAMDYSDEIELYNSTRGELQITASDLFKNKHQSSFYVVKVETPISATGDLSEGIRTTYLQFHATVTPGKAEVKGFQMNTNYSEGGVSEFMPSFRVVSRAPQLIAADDSSNPQVKAVTGFGTLYGLKSQVAENDMTIEYSGESVSGTSANTYYVEADEAGVLSNWPQSASDEDSSAYSYYAVTFKSLGYNYDMLETEYCVKAYVVTEDGSVVYEKEAGDTSAVKTAKIYDIADTLYKNSMMTTKESHNYLYDNVLNIVDMYKNRDNIMVTMLKEMKVPTGDRDNDEFRYANTFYSDVYYYTHFTNVYKEGSYAERGEFTSRTMIGDVENEELLLEKLNGIEGNEKTYKRTAEWIREKVVDKGFHEVITYSPEKADGMVDSARE